MSDYKQTRDAAGKVTSQYDKMLRSLDDDLVERLKARLKALYDDPREYSPGQISEASVMALTHIEELEAKHQETFQMYVDANEARIDAEAKLAKAVEGLEESQEEIDDYIRREYQSDCPVHERYRQWDFAANPARIALAELKGQGDEG